MDNQSSRNQPDDTFVRQNGCRRCGDCCLRGGPCLHREDREIIERDLPLTDLFTIRQGEPARDNISNRICCVDEDIIKIRSRPGSTACLFFDGAHHSCAIYCSRPLECRALKCWNPKEIIDVYDKQRLSRKELLEDRKGLWELVAVHQEMCDYGKIGQLVRDKDKTALAGLVRFDRSYRELVIERGLLDAAALDFFFGFPLTITIRRYGISLQDIGVAAEQN